MSNSSAKYLKDKAIRTRPPGASISTTAKARVPVKLPVPVVPILEQFRANALRCFAASLRHQPKNLLYLGRIVGTGRLRSQVA